MTTQAIALDILESTPPRTTASVSPMRIVWVLLRALLILCMLTGALVVASSALPRLLGLQGMVVSSGSMEPTIRTGDTVLIRPVDPGTIRSGDVITFRTYATQRMVTHRVVDIKRIDGSTYFRTQGDANSSPDANLAPAGSVSGKVRLILPKAGYLVYFASTYWGRLFLIGFPLIILMTQELRALLRSKARSESSGRPAGPAKVRSYGAPVAA